MYTHISNATEYKDKLAQAEYAYDKGDWRTAFGYFSSCLNYAERNNMNTSYLEMKVEDCRKRM